MALEKQTKEIEAKRRDVMADLAQVEPAVIEAQNGLTLYNTRMIMWYPFVYVPVLVTTRLYLANIKGLT